MVDSRIYWNSLPKIWLNWIYIICYKYKSCDICHLSFCKFPIFSLCGSVGHCFSHIVFAVIRLQVPHLRSLVLKLHCFISVRLFPPKPQDLPPMPKCTWWVPSATKVLALLSKYMYTEILTLHSNLTMLVVTCQRFKRHSYSLNRMY